MFDRAKLSRRPRITSAFISSGGSRTSRQDVWADAGRSIELAYRRQGLIGATASRAVIALALVVAARLCTVLG